MARRIREIHFPLDNSTLARRICARKTEIYLSAEANQQSAPRSHVSCTPSSAGGLPCKRAAGNFIAAAALSQREMRRRRCLRRPFADGGRKRSKDRQQGSAVNPMPNRLTMLSTAAHELRAASSIRPRRRRQVNPNEPRAQTTGGREAAPCLRARGPGDPAGGAQHAKGPAPVAAAPATAATSPSNQPL